MQTFAAAPPAPRHAALFAAFFMPLAMAPWLNPVSGGAMTAGIPLLVGWMCTALLFSGLPALRWSLQGVVAVAVLALAVVWSLVFNSQWQLLAVSLLLMAAAAVVGVRLV
ncbi:MAG: hypothetical protein Q4G39_06730, partial [Brachymonas sp.]|nr:hypothetical protein [Brachymonas sp.]